jgi:hypothetical protein
MKGSGKAIVRLVNKQKFVWKSLNAGAILARAFEEWESNGEKEGRGDGGTGGRGDKEQYITNSHEC